MFTLGTPTTDVVQYVVGTKDELPAGVDSPQAWNDSVKSDLNAAMTFPVWDLGSTTVTRNQQTWTRRRLFWIEGSAPQIGTFDTSFDGDRVCMIKTWGAAVLDGQAADLFEQARSGLSLKPAGDTSSNSPAPAASAASADTTAPPAATPTSAADGTAASASPATSPDSSTTNTPASSGPAAAETAPPSAPPDQALTDYALDGPYHTRLSSAWAPVAGSPGTFTTTSSGKAAAYIAYEVKAVASLPADLTTEDGMAGFYESRIQDFTKNPVTRIDSLSITSPSGAWKQYRSSITMDLTPYQLVISIHFDNGWMVGIKAWTPSDTAAAMTDAFAAARDGIYIPGK
jgi:hypothetical protein